MYISPFFAVFIAVAIYVWTNWDAPEYNGCSGCYEDRDTHTARAPCIYVWGSICVAYTVFVIVYNLFF